MATGTFTYNALRMKTLKKAHKNTKKNCKSFKLYKSNAVSIGTTVVKPDLLISPVGFVWFARYCGKMYSRHLFSYSGLLAANIRCTPAVFSTASVLFITKFNRHFEYVEAIFQASFSNF